ncbi:glycosyltransferase family 2 protein [Candidatus Sumerlaeota bacterium]|nr:glycosyltransferase family 2 protein [Candidatus Sumerlaeota bacterium]
MTKPRRTPLLSVIVPVYNERRTIDLLLEKVRAVPIDKEIIVVDGASEDGTVDILRKQMKVAGTRVILQKERRGRGNALKVGIRAARGKYIIFQDADLELDPNDYPALLEPLLQGKADVVFGSRLLRGKPNMTFLQYWGNKVINWSVNILYAPELKGAWLTDVETCYQVFKRDAFRHFTIGNNHFAFTVELTVRLILAGYRIAEIPISYFPRGKAEGKKIYWGDGIASLWTLLRIRIFN